MQGLKQPKPINTTIINKLREMIRSVEAQNNIHMIEPITEVRSQKVYNHALHQIFIEVYDD